MGNNDHGGTPFGPWDTPAIMQYSDKAVFPGISGMCDANAVYVDDNELQSYQTNGGIDMPLTKADALMVADAVINRDVNLAMGGSTPNSGNRLGSLVEKAATQRQHELQAKINRGICQLAICFKGRDGMAKGVS